MKLASYKDGSRDGQLLVVSRDLSSAHYATGIATRLQQVLDDWNFLSPQLEDLSQTLNHGKARHAFAFDPRLCLAPLPRTWLWAEAQTAGPATHPGVPRWVLGRSDALGGPGEPIVLPRVGQANPAQPAALDARPQLAAILGDVLEGTGPKAALDGVRLLMLASSLHGLEEGGLGGAGSPGALQVACSPVAATPDELGPAWEQGRLRLNLEILRNGKRLGLAELGEDMPWHLGELVALLAEHHGLGAGCLVGSGLRLPADGSRGDACVQHRREREGTDPRAPQTPWLQAGDSLRITLKGRDGLTVFGDIDQTVLAAG
jgi:fumarylacetoacetate (FAA) hydrolase